MKHSRGNIKSGSQYEFSNTGYILLASLTEEVTEMPFPRFFQENIFEPLKMKSSYACGDDGVYYAIGDFSKWLIALHDESLFKPQWRNKLFAPSRLNSGKKILIGTM